MIDNSVSTLQIKRYQTAGGAQIFQIPLHEFPILDGYAYVVLIDDFEGASYRVLIDTGSGFGHSNQHLQDGLQQVCTQYGYALDFQDLTHILITHGHIDHIGGLHFIRERSGALLGIHELDVRYLISYEEQIAITTRRLAQYLAEAGVAEPLQVEYLEFFQLHKSLFRSIDVDFTYEKEGMQVGPFEMLHVPGHSAGHVVIRLDDFLFSGDHILSEISPHQFPEKLFLYTGLGHYLESLEKVLDWSGQINLTLGGHKKPITNLTLRIEEIRSLHKERLKAVIGLCDSPKTIAEISHALFADVEGYNNLLALEEAGAYTEFLYNHGELHMINYEEVLRSDIPVPEHYQRY